MKNIIVLFLAPLFLLSCSKDDDGANKLTAPTLLTPSNNSTLDISNGNWWYDFKWSHVADADQYLIQVSDASNFANILITRTLDVEEYMDNGCDLKLADLEDQKTYYWRVKAFGQGHAESDYSQGLSFTILNQDNGACSFCFKPYTGTFKGVIDGEGFDNKPMYLVYEAAVNNLYPTHFNLEFGDFNNWYETYFSITGSLENGTTLVYTNRIWDINGNTVMLNGTITFNSDFSTLTGEFELSGAHSGTLSIFATL